MANSVVFGIFSTEEQVETEVLETTGGKKGIQTWQKSISNKPQGFS